MDSLNIKPEHQQFFKELVELLDKHSVSVRTQEASELDTDWSSDYGTEIQDPTIEFCFDEEGIFTTYKTTYLDGDEYYLKDIEAE